MLTAKEELKKLVIQGVIGFVVGFALFCNVIGGLQSLGTSIGGVLLGSVIGMGFPYGWLLGRRFLAISGSCFLPILIFKILLRLGVAIYIGWIAYIIAVIKCISRTRKEE